MSPGASRTLVGDIGGTNVRFAMAQGGALEHVWSMPCAAFGDIHDALSAYRGEIAADVETVVLAVAGPIAKGRVILTNSGWVVDEGDLQRGGVRQARLINDFTALALSAPYLRPEGRRAIGPCLDVQSDATLAVLGPGTGLGVSALVREGGRDVPLATEGGHIGFSPTDDTEQEVAKIFAQAFGRVSVERILCGSGLAGLHAALAQIDGRRGETIDQRRVVELALAGDPDCRRTVERFWDILGSVSGDLALTYGAKGGVYVGGGVVARIASLLDEARFRARFEAKGRMQAYNAAIPTWLITDPHAALRGAARTLGE